MQPLPQVRPAALDDWLVGHGRVPLLLDVREPWEVERATPATSALYELRAIPMAELPDRLRELDADQPVACLCHHGARSQRVALFLQHNGFAAVANVSGGIDAWSTERDAAVPRY